MRAALFGPITADHEAMGTLAETAIFSQWFHSQNIDNLHYARWKKGEVDLVWLNMANQKPLWCVEVKWLDLPCSDSRKLKGLIEYTQKNNLSDTLVTTKTVSQKRVIDDITVKFQPSSVYTYAIGINILKEQLLQQKLSSNSRGY